MKKLMIGMIVMLAALVVLAASVRTGFGKVLTASTSPTVIKANNTAGDYGTKVSVNVTGSEVVYFMKNCSSASFVQSNAVPVAAGFPYTFEESSGRIYSVCYATASGTSEFMIAFE